MTGPPARRCLARVHSGPSACHFAAKCSSSADRAMLASSGDSTPPTQWITRRMVTLRISGVGRVRTAAGRVVDDGDAVSDGDVLGADEDVFDDHAQHALAVFDGGGVGPVGEGGQESLLDGGQGE